MPFQGVSGPSGVGGYGPSAAIDRLQTATATSFDKLVLQASGPVAVEFMSWGCPHCQHAEPKVQQAAQALEGKVKMVRVNVPSSPDLASEYGITGTPTFVFFKNGQELTRVEGAPPSAESLQKTILKAFQG